MTRQTYETKTLTCISCPLGCVLEASIDESGNCIGVTGNNCAHGSEYAKNEAIRPVRVITMSICVPGCIEPLSVKTSKPIPKDNIDSVFNILRKVNCELPIHEGDIVEVDICGTGADVVATKSLL